MSNKLVIDIETVGKNIEDFDDISKDYFTHWAEKNISGKDGLEIELKKIEEGFSFSPLTAEVVCIGLLNPETDKGMIYYQDPKQKKKEFEEKDIKFSVMDEKTMLQNFWDQVKFYDDK